MCGLFGFLKPVGADDAATAAIFAKLGRFATERGTDASGWATLAKPGASWRASKGPKPFDALWASRSARDEKALAGACAAMGHTRAASQGAPGRMANCSPMSTGTLVGTHNGDVDADDLMRRFGIVDADLAGETDTEVLLNALSGAPALEVLQSVAGRVALVWARQDRAGKLYLARGSWSPLYIARAADGVIWWVSNPAWLGPAGVDVAELVRVREGTLVEADIATAKLIGSKKFTPTARARDEYASQYAYAGFHPLDAAEDKACHVHRVRPGWSRHPEAKPWWPRPRPVKNPMLVGL